MQGRENDQALTIASDLKITLQRHHHQSTCRTHKRPCPHPALVQSTECYCSCLTRAWRKMGEIGTENSSDSHAPVSEKRISGIFSGRRRPYPTFDVPCLAKDRQDRHEKNGSGTPVSEKVRVRVQAFYIPFSLFLGVPG